MANRAANGVGPQPVVAGRAGGLTTRDLDRARGMALVGATDNMIARALRISPATLKQWVVAWPILEKTITEARADYTEETLGALQMRVTMGDTTAIKFSLGMLYPELRAAPKTDQEDMADRVASMLAGVGTVARPGFEQEPAETQDAQVED